MAEAAIPVPRDVRDDLRETKPADLTWPEYLLRLRDGAVILNDGVRVVDADAVVAELKEELQDDAAE